MEPTLFLRSLFDEAVRAADPMVCVPKHLPAQRPQQLTVIGAGKASARMAEAVEQAWGPCNGLVITRYGYERALQGIVLRSASHPVPDKAGVHATRELTSLCRQLGEQDTVVALISGGGSALMIDPTPPLSLEEKQTVNEALLASGAPIQEMNVVRKHLSRVKGGQLAAACYPAQLLALMISDVAGDDPAFIASGPTVGDPSTPQDALDIIERWRIAVPQAVLDVLGRPTGIAQPDDYRLSTTKNVVIAAPSQSLAAAKSEAEKSGIRVEILGDALEGEARTLAEDHAKLARSIASETTEPILLLSGGECTVTRTGQGRGGPNAEYCLSLAINLDGADHIFALACDTDGVDGAPDHQGIEVAGALVTPTTVQRAGDAGLDAAAALIDNDAHGFFGKLNEAVICGPTLTNVNDFRAILINSP